LQVVFFAERSCSDLSADRTDALAVYPVGGMGAEPSCVRPHCVANADLLVSKAKGGCVCAFNRRLSIATPKLEKEGSYGKCDSLAVAGGETESLAHSKPSGDSNAD